MKNRRINNYKLSLITQSSKMAFRYLTFVILCMYCVGSSLGQNDNMIRSRNSDEWRPRTRSTICVPRDCKLPDCYCPGKTGPSHLRNYQIPQMVMLTFDDAINEQVNGYYDKLFSKSRLNPNGCPISATFYLSHNWTNYDMVRNLYNSGHEIASHSITHRLPQSWWTHASLKDWYKEVNGQKKNIINKARVPKSQVKGMRVPFLELGGDKQFTMMADTGLQYDSSFMTGPYDEGGAWPFTLDYPPNWKYCSNNNCPKSSFPGVWELPMNRWIGPDGKPCPMVDACQTQPVDKEDTLGYMWYNFNRFYRGNRAPFGIHLHAVWLKKDSSYYDALDTFLDALSEMDDVYLVSAAQVVSWMKTPTSVKEISSFLPWRRSCFIKESKQRTTRKPKPTTTTTTTISTTATTTTTPTTTKPPTTKPQATTTTTTTITAKSTSTPVSITKPLREVIPEKPAVLTQMAVPFQGQERPRDQPRNIWNFPDEKPIVEGQEWRPERLNSQRGSGRNGASVYAGPPSGDDFYPPSRDVYYGRPGPVTSESPDGDRVSEALPQPRPWSRQQPQPRPQHRPQPQPRQQPQPRPQQRPRPQLPQPQPQEPILREKINVEIDVNNEEIFMNKKVDKDSSANSLTELKNKNVVTREDNTKNIQDAYESSKGEATAADKPYYQSSRNNGFIIRGGIGMVICVLTGLIAL